MNDPEMGLEGTEIAELLKCPQCGVEGRPWLDKMPLEGGGFHLKASCRECKAYIKMLPHAEPKMPFGKHKGLTVNELISESRDYAEWILPKLWETRFKRELSEALWKQRTTTSI
jgi:hypothetical protein